MSIQEIRLNRPVVEKNRVTYSWHPSQGFAASSYWVEYPDLDRLEVSPGKLTEAYFPICLALSSMPGLRIVLPVRIDEDVLSQWRTAIRAASKFFRNPETSATIENGTEDSGYRPIAGSKTALFFGGGTESLLTLARLLDQGTKPYLTSFGGPLWSGSNPETNPDKFAMDERVSRELGLPLLRVRTNFKEILASADWKPYLRDGVSMINAVLFLPFFISFILPVCETLGISRAVNGNEKMNFPDEYFCFSPGLTRHLASVARGLSYESHLNDLYKEDVCRELYTRYPELAKYQYSCWRNRSQRWCYACESCLEYYMLLKNNGLSPETVGLEAAKVREHKKKLIWAVARSAEARPGELWERMRHYPKLRQEPETARLLDAIWRRAVVYRNAYAFYRPLKRLVGAGKK